MLAVQADGTTIETVEGLSDGETLSELQAAFRRHHALQCGYCTPGILMSFTDLLEREPAPDEAASARCSAGTCAGAPATPPLSTRCST